MVDIMVNIRGNTIYVSVNENENENFVQCSNRNGNKTISSFL